MVHDLMSVCTNLARQVFERNAVEDGSDCPVELMPDRFEVTGGLAFAIIGEVAGIQA